VSCFGQPVIPSGVGRTPLPLAQRSEACVIEDRFLSERLSRGESLFSVSKPRCALAVTAFLALCLSVPLSAQEPSSKPAAKPKPNSSSDNATKNAEDQPAWDPLRAEKDLEVGQYYMRKGDVDAAIDRFEDALTAKPGVAIPFRYLGEAQEKKGLKREALNSYTKYIDMVPHADDRPRIEKRIEKLRSEMEKSKSRSTKN